MISVIVPALNEEEYIGDCLWSIENQDYSKEYEIIVMDNGSEDKTREIAKEYCDKLLVKPDLGLPELRNEGIREAEGEIIAQTDADCLVDKNWLKEAEESLEENVLVTGRIVPLENTKLYEVFLYLYNTWLRVSMNAFGFSHASGGNCAFYRDAALAMGGFKDSFPSDGKFGVDMQGSLYYDPDMLVFTSMRRYLNDSFSRTVWELLLSHIRLRYLDEKDFDKSYYWRGNRR